MTGGLGINKDVWDELSDDVKQVLTELGEEYTVAHAKEVMARYDTFLAKLPEAGATVTELPADEVAAWAAGLPVSTSRCRPARRTGNSKKRESKR